MLFESGQEKTARKIKEYFNKQGIDNIEIEKSGEESGLFFKHNTGVTTVDVYIVPLTDWHFIRILQTNILDDDVNRMDNAFMIYKNIARINGALEGTGRFVVGKNGDIYYLLNTYLPDLTFSSSYDILYTLFCNSEEYITRLYNLVYQNS